MSKKKKMIAAAIKSLLACLIIFLWPTCMLAQSNDPWLGTWKSESYKAIDMDDDSDRFVYANYRYIIRITKAEDGYLVRAKTIKISDPDNAIYDDACGIKQNVSHIDGNSILLESHREKIPFRVNGKIDSYSNTTSYFKLTLDGDVLHFSLYKYKIDHFNINMRFQGSDTYGINERYSGPCIERDLYSDDW